MSGNKSNGDHEEHFKLVTGIAFDPHESDRLLFKYAYPGGATGAGSYLRGPDGIWRTEATTESRESVHDTIKLTIMQSMNERPVLEATDQKSGLSRKIWDPNEWLDEVELEPVTVYKWNDPTGRELLGGLYKPTGYTPGKRYPLVIQAHGFSPSDFVPSGIYPTGFAARELAAVGFIVLQVRGCPVRETPDEGPCQVAAYEAAIKQLVAEGLVDPKRIGIVGFSRTCYYTLEALTTSNIAFGAASITDGVDMGYSQYLAEEKYQTSDSISVIGAAPFGKGLTTWFERSPEFNMDKVTAPLLVVGVGEGAMLSEWEPYSTLWHLDKPVDLILLKAGTHPLTNPAQRMVSQGSTVDWMRFWLQDYEDPSPMKAEQYVRWRRLRGLHDNNQTRHSVESSLPRDVTK